MLWRRLAHSMLVFVCIWVLYLFFKNIHSLSLENWDEAFYADTIRSMVTSKNFVVPYWNTQPFMDKPPLYFWLSSVAALFFGLNELSYRLPSVIASVLTIFLVAWYVYKTYGYQFSIIPILWLSSDLLFVSRGRGANLDSLATFFIFISYVLLVSKNKYKYQLWGFIVGLVFLTKASLSFYLFIILAIQITLDTQPLKIKGFNAFNAIGTYLITLLIWFIPLYLTDGMYSVRYFLFNSDQQTAKLSIQNLNTIYIYFLHQSSSSVFILFSLLGFAFMFKNVKQHSVTLLYALLLLVLLLISPVRNNWYLIPILPFWALSSAYVFKKVSELFKTTFTHWGLSLMILLLVVQHIRIYHRSLYLITTFSSTYNQARIAEFASTMRKKNTLFVRTDHYFPVAIYYSKGEVFSSPQDRIKSRGFYISRVDLMKLFDGKGKVVLMGMNSEITALKKQHNKLKILKTFGEETVAIN